jgi:sec-independent protein translocase protein TatC
MTEEAEEMDESSAPLLDHLIELRSRLIWCIIYIILAFGVSFYFSDQIYNFLAQPFVDVAMENGKEPTMIFTGLQDKFFVNIRLSFYVALCVTFPVLAMQIWKFVAPGLYQNERKAFLPFLMATPILFTLGAAMAYYIVIPRAWGFFMSFEVGVAPEVAEPGCFANSITSSRSRIFITDHFIDVCFRAELSVAGITPSPCKG